MVTGSVSSNESANKYRAPAAGCAADILVTLARAGTSLTIAQLVEATGATRSLIYRVLEELQQRSLVHTVDASEGLTYGLGLGVVELGSSFIADVPYLQSVRSALRALADRTGETASVGVLRDKNVLYLLREEGKNSVVAVSRVGKYLPAHATAIGKALLATERDEQVRQRFSEELDSGIPTLTRHSISTVPALLGELAATRARGTSVEESEAVIGRCCVGVALTPDIPGLGRLGLSVSMSEQKFQLAATEIAGLVSRTAIALSAEAKGRLALHPFADESELLSGAASILG